MNSTANDAQRLKIAGLILMALGLVAMGVIGEWIDDGRKLLSGETYYLVLVGGAWIIVVLNKSDGTFSINVTARDAFAEERIAYRGESSSCTNGSNLNNSDGTAHASCG